MSELKKALSSRSGNKCELCSATQNLDVYDIQPCDQPSEDTSILLCSSCLSQIKGETPLDEKHWYCLNDVMWSEHKPVQVMAYRVLTALGSDLVDQMYLEEDTLSWAKQNIPGKSSGYYSKDSNGTALADGDSVTLIKDLDVKGAGFTAKRGTMVKNIRLTDDPKFIEGKINGTSIVLVSAYLKKA